MSKPSLPPARLQAMVQVRLIASAEVQRLIAKDPSLAPRAGEVIRHDRDSSGRNWTILDLERGQGLERIFRSIVDSLRRDYDSA